MVQKSQSTKCSDFKTNSVEKSKAICRNVWRSFTPTVGCLIRWKERNNIVLEKLHGEKSDADFQAGDYWRKEVLQDLLKECESQLIFNADETGLYYRALPEHTFMFEGKENSGSKK